MSPKYAKHVVLGQAINDEAKKRSKASKAATSIVRKTSETFSESEYVN